MKGLLIKDLKLMMVQKNSIIIIFAVSLFFLFSGTNTSFGATYVTILMPLFALSTVSYDEFDNGMSFLMTLPVNRSLYVQEKYLLGLMCAALAGLISSVFLFASSTVRGGDFTLEMFWECICFFIMAAVMISITLPLRLKYGSEKYRIAMLILVGIAVLAGFIVINAVKYFRIDLSGLLRQTEQLFLVLLAVTCIAVVLISYVVSLQIMKKKEF